MAKKNYNFKSLKNGLVLPDLKRFSKIKEEFLQKEEQKAKIFARWEINFLWTRFREMNVSDFLAIDLERLTVSELIVYKQLKYILDTGDVRELNKIYDRLLGKPKETIEDFDLGDVELIAEVLENPKKLESSDSEESDIIDISNDAT